MQMRHREDSGRRAHWQVSRSPQGSAPNLSYLSTYRREVVMTQSTHPSKHVVRAYLERRSQAAKPPPTPQEIRRQLGWTLLAGDNKMGNFSNP